MCAPLSLSRSLVSLSHLPLDSSFPAGRFFTSLMLIHEEEKEEEEEEDKENERGEKKVEQESEQGKEVEKGKKWICSIKHQNLA